MTWSRPGTTSWWLARPPTGAGRAARGPGRAGRSTKGRPYVRGVEASRRPAASPRARPSPWSTSYLTTFELDGPFSRARRPGIRPGPGRSPAWSFARDNGSLVEDLAAPDSARFGAFERAGQAGRAQRALLAVRLGLFKLIRQFGEPQLASSALAGQQVSQRGGWAGWGGARGARHYHPPRPGRPGQALRRGCEDRHQPGGNGRRAVWRGRVDLSAAARAARWLDGGAC